MATVTISGPRLLLISVKALHKRKRYTPAELRQRAVEWGMRRNWSEVEIVGVLDKMDAMGVVVK